MSIPSSLLLVLFRLTVQRRNATIRAPRHFLRSGPLETIVRDQVLEFLETNVLIRNSQHGFRKGSSCLTNLLLFLDKVLGLHSVNDGFLVDIVLLDLAKALKAFDKVPHKRLLEKLNKHGIIGKLLSIISNWLSD